LTLGEKENTVEINFNENYTVSENVRKVDLSKIHIGDAVKITYLDGHKGNYITFIEVLKVDNN
jgi:hypothetical protein